MNFPRTSGNDVVGVFAIHSGKFSRYVLLVDIEQILFVAQDLNFHVLGIIQLFFRQFRLGDIYGSILLASNQPYADYQQDTEER